MDENDRFYVTVQQYYNSVRSGRINIDYYSVDLSLARVALGFAERPQGAAPTAPR